MKLKFVSACGFLSEYPTLTEEERESAGEFLESADADSEVAFAYASGTLILRYFDTDEG